MTTDFVVGFARQGVEITLLLSAPMLGLGLIVGLAISIFQAVTHIQEMTLTFVPKIVAVLMGMLFFLPWMMRLFIDYTADILTNFPLYVK
ncbi:MAG: flagellar biosynthesis protein FliQ [Deltaproteobacteria bacterium]|nr:flagellar biosynthesis protein FliQ [Deltaproteobacteria bacterium]